MRESGKTSEEIPAPKYEVLFTEGARTDVGALDGRASRCQGGTFLRAFELHGVQCGQPSSWCCC